MRLRTRSKLLRTTRKNRRRLESLEDRRLLAVTAVDDSYVASNPINEDQTLTIPDGANDLLANDTGTSVMLSSFDGTSANGASVNVNDDGSFSYDPTNSATIDALDEGEILTDTFTYTATDTAPVFTAGPLQVHVYDGTNNNITTADAARGSNTVGDPVTPGDNAGPDTIATASIGSNGAGSFGGHAAVPAPGGGDNYAVFLTGFISVDNSSNASGTWTFGTYSDDNSRIRIDLDQDGVLEGDLGAVNGETVAFQNGCCGEVLSPELTIADGVYEFEFVYTEGGGGDYGEFFYAPGTPAYDVANYSLFGDDSRGITTGNYELPAASETDSATVSIQVTGVNDAPIANPDTNTIIEEANNVPAANTVTGNVLTNDTDVDDDNSSFTVTNDGTYTGNYGELVLNTDGSYTYTLDDSHPDVQALQTGGASLSENFPYDMSDNHDDGNVKSASSSLAITIDGSNDAPVANDDPDTIPGAYQVDENGTLTIGPAEGLLVNDTDVDNGSLGVASIDTTGTQGLVTADLDSGALGTLFGEFLDLDDGTDLVGNRTGNSDQLFEPLDPFVANGVSDFVLQRFPITPTGDAAGVITPRVDFGAGTETTQGDGTVLDRGGFNSGSVPPWQGLFNDQGITADMDGDQVVASWSGKIEITTAGTYTFTTRSDDGSVLFINGNQVVNNNKSQGMANRSGSVDLTPGLHDISVGFFEGTSDAGVQASYEGPDTTGRVIIPPAVLYNDVATPGTFVSGGLRGDYYDVNNSGSNGGFNFNSDEFLLFATEPTDNIAMEALRASATQTVERIDFGGGTENQPGDGTVLDRGTTNGNLYGGVNVNLGNDQLGGLFTGMIRIPEAADFQFTARSDDHSRVYLDINDDGDFNDAGELVASNQGGMDNETNGAVTLTAGLHAFKAVSGEGTGGAGFQVSWEQLTGNTFAREIIPPTAFTTTLTGDGSFTYDPNGQFESLAVGQTATDTFTYTLTDQAPSDPTVTSQQSDAAFAVSGSDLLEGITPVVTGSALGGQEGTSSDSTVLTNGTFGTAGMPLDGTETLSISDNTTFTYSLDTATNPQGYSIDAIKTYSGWRDAGRADQDYTVSIATVDDPGVFTPLTTVSLAVGSAGSEVNVADFGASRVGEIRFEFGAQENGYVGYREIDVQGIATPTATATVTINGENDAPTVAADTDPVMVTEGMIATNTGTFNDIEVNDTVTITADVGNITMQDTGTNAGTWAWELDTASGLIDSQTITITATDNNNASSTTTFELVVNNVAPELQNVAVTNANENQSVTLTGDIVGETSPEDTFILNVDWNDPNAPGSEQFTFPAGTSDFSVTHTYADDDPSGTPADDYDIRVSLTDDNATGIGVNFASATGGTAQGTSNVTMPTGAYVISDWNNVGDGSGNGSQDDLNSSAGATTADVAWTSANTYSLNSWPDDGGIGSLFRTYLDTGSGGFADGTNIDFTDVGFAGYDLYVYFDGDSTGRFGDYEVSSTSATETQVGNDEANGGGNFVLDIGTPTDDGNYLRFVGLTGDSPTLRTGANATGFRAGVNAVQLVEASVVTVTTTITNLPPTATGDSGSTDEDSVLTVAAPGVLTNDTDPSPADTFTVTDLNGSGSLTGTSDNGATVTIDADGSYTYDPTGAAALQALSAGDTLDDTFTYTMSDDDTGTATATVTVTVTGVNDPVTNVDAGGPYTVAEGGSFTLGGSFEDLDNNDTYTIGWTINGSVVSGATELDSVVTYSQLQAIGIDDGTTPVPTFDVELTVNDNAGSEETSATPGTLSLTNGPPTASIEAMDQFGNSISQIVPGYDVTFTVSADDPSNTDDMANFTYMIDFDGDGTFDQTATGPMSGVEFTTQYDSLGTRNVQATATDKDGGVSDIANFSLDVVPVAQIGNDIVAGGTDGSSDRIIFYPTNDGVQVRYNNSIYPTDNSSFTVTPAPDPNPTRLIAFGRGSSDQIIVAGRIDANAEFDGGDGNDYLTSVDANDTLVGGSGNDILLAGEGDNFIDGGDGIDRLEGRSGDDVIFGGAGNDRLNGNAGDDILDGGADNDFLFGGLGDDLLVGRVGVDTLNGHYGNDVILGGASADQIFGSSDNDLLIGGTAADRVRGDAGNDDLIGGTSALDDDIESALDAMMASLGTSLAMADANVDQQINEWFDTGSDREGFEPFADDGAVDDLTGDGGNDEFHTSGDSIRDFRSDDSMIP